MMIGYCGKCPADERLRPWNQVHHWSRHVKFAEHNEPVQYICKHCALVVQRQSQLENHMCTVMLKKLDEATNVQEYRVLPYDSKWMQDLRSKYPEDLADIANEQKIVVPSEYLSQLHPPLL